MYIETKELSKQFGGLRAVNNVDFSIDKGKINAIIGPNGAGKTTFFNLISGVYKPTSGQVMFKGKDISTLPANKIAELGVARTFQTTHLFEKSNVFENVVVGHSLRTQSNLWDAIFRTKRLKQEQERSNQKALEVISFVGLSNVADVPVANLSQEEKKRVAFALALATDPEIIFLDEPTAGVNPDETEELSALIKKMAQQGITICLIEHKMKMIMELADKIMVLNYGEKIAEGTPNEINQNEEVIRAYLGGSASA
ncbi:MULTISPECIES: ABC transporter ATP-binding protein [Oceanobacillus]|uniref:ABC transporter ATP-binding protein n=1 Tax=Oceanobacillus kimchii TaxID=746691 RepID=A0ABQ5TE97_9BACI|nr:MULTISPECIES: ABC transporter ATP-binding protein [Oceanobacillus]MBT2600637.1 ABC transporter ATP-binding protein [Oceanobacillus sp. ISL-74]MBT2650966.1 ABC transporter ATP-binding protein [Oceanobacillus sp. ISL-73]MCT1578968.1 ABC transporter ATP-binding protein [Oceanobacillus kimchii]MCT2137893.1 ABC transporter ATP-binding protein [Oceanobacillus kimchii]OEH53435.1 high-affinity branched-chain amino acid ABC transporter ATP-binding protein LivG [Oceanobacillus sp. E9]